MGGQEFYIREANDTDARGPFSLEQLTSLAESGGVTKETLHYDATTEKWVTLDSNADVKAAVWAEKRGISDGRIGPGQLGNCSMEVTSSSGIPRGVNVLIEKARADPAFRKLLLEDPVAAARRSGLELLPAEITLLEGWSRIWSRPAGERLQEGPVGPRARTQFLRRILATLAFLAFLIFVTSFILLIAAAVLGVVTWIPAVVLALAALGGWKLMDRLAPPPSPPIPPPPPLPPLLDLSPSALQQRLSELVYRPKPPDMGAHCYSIDPGSKETRAVHNYICSGCGNRTSYAPKAGKAYWEARGLPHLRSLLPPLSALGAELDDRELCAYCSPAVKAPSVTLIVRPPGAPERRIRGVTASDLEQLSAFLAGDKYPNSPFFPLQYDPRRLAELLGLEKP